MRKPSYLSYSALSIFESDPDEWVMRYLVDDRLDREAQGKPASVGSAFDARVKAFMYEYSYGQGYMPEKYSYEALFEKQVESHNRDFAGPAGEHCFESYKVSGFLDSLIELADKCIEPPQYEFRVEREVGGVPLLGLPDGHFKLPDVNIVLDFKVNGYCGKSTMSPAAGYLLCRDGYDIGKPSRSHGMTHKNATPKPYKGVTVGGYMEDASEQWASQLTGYSWCLGADVGDENTVLVIHQCTAKPVFESHPLLRFSSYVGPVRRPYQEHLLARYQKCWKAIIEGHPFLDLSKEESDKRFALLEAQSTFLRKEENSFLVQMVRPTFRGK